jgi:hypothetical protein
MLREKLMNIGAKATTLWVESSSTGDPRLRGALPKSDIRPFASQNTAKRAIFTASMGLPARAQGRPTRTQAFKVAGRKSMTQIFARIAAAMSLLAFAVAVPTGAASAQGAKELLGAWTIVSITVEGDGKKSEPFGPNPGGTQTYDSNGRFASMALRSDLPKIASNNRGTATLEESQKIVHGSMAYYGSYTINEAEKSITMQMEGATFPNWVGTTHKRLFAISGDTLTVTNPTPSGGGGILTVVLKRAGQKPM